MDGGELIREARRRAGITQRQLARRLGTSQPVIARWERGHRSPDYDVVRGAVLVCGFELRSTLVERDLQDEATLDYSLGLTPLERLRSNQAMLDLEAIARNASRSAEIGGPE
jgi:transcriptional regulator with XRE-family HTH domain